jgi:sterol desaturase/sphingolipid hydroxylase (fatty acid hydroxylase superfamily)
MSIILTLLLTLVGGMMYVSIFEWSLHKYVMHQVVGGFRYPFVTHTLIHHKLFKADLTYHIQPGIENEKITMAWWHGFVLSLIGMIPFTVAALVIARLVGAREGYLVFVEGLCISAGYYIAYEYLHWCMHLPRNRIVERSRIFRMLNGHHILHHRYMWTNYNVVFPFADMLFGTLLLRASKPFSQVEGRAVPSVQP